MNLLTALFVCFLSIRTEEELVSIRKVHFKKNKISAADRKKLENDNKKENLFNVAILEETERDEIDAHHDHKRNIFSTEPEDPINNECYGQTIRKILSFYESYRVGESLLNRHYVLAKSSVENIRDFQILNKEKVIYSIYQLVEETPKNNNEASTEDNELETRIFHIKSVLRKIMSTEILNLDEFITDIDTNGFKRAIRMLNDGRFFKLFYFENYSKCFKSLKKFVKIVSRSDFEWDDICKLLHEKFSKDIKNLPVFNELNKDLTQQTEEIEGKLAKEFLSNKSPEFINKYFTSFEQNLNDAKKLITQINKTINHFFKICCGFVKNQMIRNVVFTPLYGDYGSNNYFEKFYLLIYETIVSFEFKYNTAHTGHDLVIEQMIKELDDNLKKFQGEITEDLCNFKYFQNCFSELFRRNISTLDDYIDVEKIACDFNNMFAFISNMARRMNDKSCKLLSLYSPVPDKKYSSKVISGIEIIFNDQTKFKEIKAFDDQGKKISMMKNGEFSIDEIKTFYFTSEVIRKLNIQEFEISFTDDNLPSKKVKVKDFLSE